MSLEIPTLLLGKSFCFGWLDLQCGLWVICCMMCFLPTFLVIVVIIGHSNSIFCLWCPFSNIIFFSQNLVFFEVLFLLFVFVIKLSWYCLCCSGKDIPSVNFFFLLFFSSLLHPKSSFSKVLFLLFVFVIELSWYYLCCLGKNVPRVTFFFI